jgi:hypothetical protein
MDLKSRNMKSGEHNSYCMYCFDLPELVGGKDTLISSDLLHGLEDVLSLSKLDLALHLNLSKHSLHPIQVHQPRMHVRYIVANDGPLGNMHRR